MPFLFCDMLMPLLTHSECMGQGQFLPLRTWMLGLGTLELLLLLGWLAFCIKLCRGAVVSSESATRIHRSFSIAYCIKGLLCTVVESIFALTVAAYDPCSTVVFSYFTIIFMIHFWIIVQGTIFLVCPERRIFERTLRAFSLIT